MKSTTFRWLDAARYAVATVVTVLIGVVIVHAIKVVLRPESLRLWVVQGSVYTTPASTEKVTLSLNLRAENPSGRVRMYFFNITAYLFNNRTLETTTKPEEDCIILFYPANIAVAQQVSVDTITQVEGTSDPSVMDQFYFNKLYTERGIIRDAAIRVDGTLVTEVRSGFNKTRTGTTYYCWPLVIGGSPGDNKASNGDLRCTESSMSD